MSIKNETTYRAVLGSLLASLREERRLTQDAVAKMVGVSAPTWSRIEKGDNPLTTEQLRRAAIGMEMTASAILALEEATVAELAGRGIDVREDLSRDEAEPSSFANVGNMVAAFAIPVLGSVLSNLVSRSATFAAWKEEADPAPGKQPKKN
jgi:transcriptional regulator with XRE-family HTH domain